MKGLIPASWSSPHGCARVGSTPSRMGDEAVKHSSTGEEGLDVRRGMIQMDAILRGEQGEMT